MKHSNDVKLRDFLRRLPDWMRKDLASSDATRRERAEDALHAMLLPLLVSGADGP
ncbi:hypothetical protein SLG_19340 [Sphingobium sp. SYK-6]|uniref:hypothetical protein n=1 Tax=Sphingobium sp. (strain NBRC 103272 / SYK-6) TaxID=627192 RepID=UPI00022774E2|nr:hypothetical protein [Sphingobium sp. SYK-6]BAK66609.1 hypothetical protein SLG_19340 [Sphingobium sp. SYK-6]